jgi:hypothetical protein
MVAEELMRPGVANAVSFPPTTVWHACAARLVDPGTPTVLEVAMNNGFSEEDLRATVAIAKEHEDDIEAA